MTPETICFPFVGNLVGGSHLSASRLIERLDRDRYRPLVLVQHRSGAIVDLLRKMGIEYELAPPTPDLAHGAHVPVVAGFRLLAQAPGLARFLRRRNCSIVHCNDGRTLATWALPAKLSGAKLLWHHRGSPDAVGLRLLAPCLADRVVAVSNFAAPRPGIYSAARRSHVIHSPFDTESSYDRESARKRLMEMVPDASAATRFVAFSGVLIDRKRPVLFVEAIAALQRMCPTKDIRGVLFGEPLDGMEARVHVRASELGISDHIHHLGFRTPGPFWLASCDVLMVPALHEPFGRTLIEAMLVGTPVVATASGGNIEAIRHGETGLLVPPEDARELAAGCASILLDRDLAERISQTAREAASHHFGEATHAMQVMNVYRDMLRREGPVRLRQHAAS